MASNTYLSSTDVSIFPYAPPRTNSPTDNVFYEQNTTNMIRQITRAFFGTDSFVIGDASIIDSDNNIIPQVEFCIHGYYFRVNKAALTAMRSGNTTLTGYIAVQKATTSAPEYIIGQDSNGEFQALSFSEPDSSDGSISVFSLDILDAAGNLIVTPFLGVESIDGAHQ